MPFWTSKSIIHVLRTIPTSETIFKGSLELFVLRPSCWCMFQTVNSGIQHRLELFVFFNVSNCSPLHAWACRFHGNYHFQHHILTLNNNNIYYIQYVLLLSFPCPVDTVNNSSLSSLICCEAALTHLSTIILLLTLVSPNQTYVIPASLLAGPAVAWAIGKEGGGGGRGE